MVVPHPISLAFRLETQTRYHSRVSRIDAGFYPRSEVYRERLYNCQHDAFLDRFGFQFHRRRSMF
jgi:hypothetical protein